MSEIDIHELGAAYALDALDPPERAAFEAHFASCGTCRREVGEYRETAAALGAATEVAPPAGLRSRVLAEVAATRQLAPHAAAPVVDLASRRRPVLAAIAALAAAVVLVVAGALVVRGRGDSFSDQVAAMMDDPATRMAQLDGRAGGFKLVWDDVHVAVLGDALPAPDDGMRYELWLIDDAGAHPMNLLDAADDGSVRRMLDVPEMNVAAWGVTLEPAAGSPAPTTPVMYQADVRASR